MGIRTCRACVVAILCFATQALAAPPTISSFNPSAGPIYASVAIAGSSFTGATAVSIGGTATKFTVSSASKVIAIVPVGGSGPISITTPGGTATTSSSFTVTPSAALAPINAPPGQTVTLQGAGFSAYAAIDVYFDTADTALVVSNGAGVVKTSVVIPASALPGQHWFTLVQRNGGTAAQAALTVSTDWIEDAFAPNGRGYNAFENLLDAGNVNLLDAQWVQPEGYYANAAPIVESNGTLINGDINGNVRAFNASGKLLWTASTGAWLAQIDPVVISGLVVFGTNNGTTLYAFKAACGTTGGVCAPSWTATLPVNITGGLSTFNGSIIVPGADGQIYPVNPANGAIGTPYYAYDNSHGPIVTPVHFGVDGSFFYGTTSAFEGHYPNGGSFYGTTSGYGFSAGAVLGGQVYYMDSNNLLNTGSTEVTLPGTSGCLADLAVANGFVFASTCTTIGAYSTQSGQSYWVDSIPGPVLGGITVANGVVYACVNFQLTAYEASYGSLLFAGGSCDTTPVVVNGAVYVFSANLAAFTVNGAAPAHAARERPVVSRLQPDMALVAQRMAD